MLIKKTLEYMKANDKDGENRLKVFNQSWGTSLLKEMNIFIMEIKKN